MYRTPPVRRDALDCSQLGSAVFWFAVGASLALVVMSSYAAGNWTSLLRVGSQNPALVGIERELGPVSNADTTGHDGQLYYLIARDPLGVRGTPDVIARFDNNGPRYRYRRILFPLLAGGFGQLSGPATLAGMIILLTVGMGLATLAIADISFQLNLRGVTVLAASLNAGAVVSLLLLTADAMAVALALAGIALVLRGQLIRALGLFALAALTKEVYLLVPIGVAAWSWYEHRRRLAFAFLIAPSVPLVVWSGWLVISMPETFTAVRNIGAPFRGMSQAFGIWIHSERNPIELFLIAFAALTLASAIAALIAGRNSLLRWSIGPWLGLACLAALPVWGKPNNAARAFAILWPLTVLLVSDRLSRGRRTKARIVSRTARETARRRGSTISNGR